MPITGVKETFQRYVEAGRIALISKGQYEGKLVVIVDIVNHRHALVDSPQGADHVPRQVINFNDLILTPLSIKKFPRLARTSVVARKWEASKISEQWASSAWAKKLEQRKVRANLNDFDRFCAMRLKKQRSYQINKALAKAA